MAAQNQNKVSLPVIKRLPKYYRYISDMHNNGIVKVSSSELARMMGTTASQVRQDFNCFGGFGQQGIGYHVDVLLSEISKLLFSEKNLNAVLIGTEMCIRDRYPPRCSRRCWAAHHPANSRSGQSGEATPPTLPE